MDNRKGNGGSRIGAGRKPKAAEIQLIELLSPLDETALKAIQKGVNSGEFAYIKLFMEYRYGKPKQQIELDTTISGIKSILIEPASKTTGK